MEITQTVSAAQLLLDVRELRAVSLAADAALLRQAACWADLHPASEPGAAATFHQRGRDTGMALTAVGLPDVSADCVAELAAALGMATAGGERLIAHALELRHRLPRLWALVHDGEVAAWQARQVADQTLSLSVVAAGFVDVQVAAVVGRVSPTQLDRLITAALIRYMPVEAERRRLEAVEGRCFEVAHDRTGRQHGLSDVWGRLDLPDALALDAAVSDGARALGALGSTESLDVRRARAAGDLARRQPALDLLTAEAAGDAPLSPLGDSQGDGSVVGAPGRWTDQSPGATQPPGAAVERVVLYLHLSEEVFRTGVDDGCSRVENTGCPVTAGQVRDWCGRPGARVTVKPVIDLTTDEVEDGYQVPGWMREKVALRDGHCVFPFCTRPAHPYPSRRVKPGDSRQGWRVDTDHTIAHQAGGPTSPGNLAPLCRAHHLLKTFAGWRYRVSGTRSYEWTSPHQLRYLRTPDGATHDLQTHDHGTHNDGTHDPGTQDPSTTHDPNRWLDSTVLQQRNRRRPGALEPPPQNRRPLPFERDPAPDLTRATGADPPPF